MSRGLPLRRARGARHAGRKIGPWAVDAAQRWVSILNPSAETLEEGVKPLLEEAPDRLVRQHALRGRTAGE